MNTAIDAKFVGIQTSYSATDFYADLVEKALEKHSDGGGRKLSILNDPSEPISSTHNSHVGSRSPRVILGSGLNGPFGRASKTDNLSFRGVRGFLTLNRLPCIDTEETCIGDLAVLSASLDAESGINHGILYVQTESSAESESLRESLEPLGAGFVSIADGFASLLENTKGARTVISDGVIGLAVADSFGIPNVWHQRSADRSVEFQVLDYFSGVRRPLHNRLRSIPQCLNLIEKQSRVASPELIHSQSLDLLTSLKEILELQISLEPAVLLESKRQLFDEPIRAEIPVKGVQSGKIEIDYEYTGTESRRQILVALDLESDVIDFDTVEEIPKLQKSSRPEIGFFRYVSFKHEVGTAELRIDLPEGVLCRGISVFRWSDKEYEIYISSLTLHRYR